MYNILQNFRLGKKRQIVEYGCANRTCKIYTIIESCKLCGVDPYKYLCEILSREPGIGESWSDMLPSNIKFA